MEPTPRPAVSRTPGQDDLVRLCAELNAHGVRYVVVGGFAVIQQTGREMDAVDRRFLRERLELSGREETVVSASISPRLWRFTVAVCVASLLAVLGLLALLLRQR